MKLNRNIQRAFLFGTCLLGLTACELRQAMYNQPKVKPQAKSDFFADGRGGRPLVEGTVARGHLENDELFYKGMSGGKPIDQFPFAIGPTDLARGREQFDIFCSVCHGQAGYGDGMIVQRGYPKAKSLHELYLRQSPAGHFYDVISNGWGQMPGYREQIVDARDRWLIVAYVRALQLSQHASLNDVPAEERSKMGAKPQ